MVNFDTTEEESSVIHKIAVRAVATAKKAGIAYPLQDAEMDITACHLNGCPLRLEEMLSAKDSHFGHDVFGIRRYLDRKTGKLTGFFDPRYSLPVETEGEANA